MRTTTRLGMATMALTLTLSLTLTLALLGTPARAAEIQLIDDPLQGSTVGVQQGGAFVPGGWQAAAGEVRIDYDLGRAYGAGRLELDVTNFDPCHQPNAEKVHILAMWQGAKARQPSIDADEAHWIFRTGTGYQPPLNQAACTMPLEDCCEYKLISKPSGPLATAPDHEARVDTAFPWSLSATYHYQVIWSAGGRVQLLRDGITLYDHNHGAPLFLRFLQVGRDSETKPNYGEQPGVIYANVQVFVDDAVGLCEAPCDDLDPCTVNDLCATATSCVGTAVVCDTPPTVCHEALGACQAGVGTCDYDLLPNGTACPGGSCQGGICQPLSDAGVPDDSGSASDGALSPDAAVPPTDGAPSPDAHPNPDGGFAQDADTHVDPAVTTGCACRGAGTGGSTPWTLTALGLLILLIIRRSARV